MSMFKYEEMATTTFDHTVTSCQNTIQIYVAIFQEMHTKVVPHALSS